MDRFSRSLFVAVLFALMLAVIANGCGGDDDDDDNGTSDDDSADEGPFNVTINGSGFDVHNGQTMTVGVMNETNEEMLEIDQAVLTDGTFSFSFEAILTSGFEYHVHYFADNNENDMCDPAPDDHAWLVVLDNPTEDVVIDVTHNTDFTDDPDCDMFNEMMM